MKIAFFGINDQQKIAQYKSTFSDHQLSFFEQCLDITQSPPSESDYDIISVFVHCKVDKQTIDTFSNLKFIITRSTGYDHIDLEYAKSKNILVSNIPAYGSDTVAEFTFALLLALSRKIITANNRVRQSLNLDYHDLLGFDLNKKTLGVVGTGKIGAHVISIAKGFNMQIQAYDLYPNDQLSKDLNFPYVDLATLLSTSDIITFHIPSSPSSNHLLNNENIFNVKKGAVIINTARGSIIKTQALYDALKANHIAAAGLDVLEEENELATNENPTVKQLISLPNVIFTPHMAHFSQEAEDNITQTTILSIKSFINQKPINLVG